MAFKKALIHVKSAAASGTGVKASLVKMRGASAKLSVIFSKALSDRFGWANGDKLEVLLGTDSDHGLLRFRKNNSTGEAVVSVRYARAGREYTKIYLGHQAAFVDRAEPAKHCQFEEVDDGWIEVVLPRWAEETGVKAAKSVIAAPGPVTAPKPPVGRAVTASLMGDPPPGRREALEAIGRIKA